MHSFSMGYGDQKKFTTKSPPFFNAKFPGKFEEKIAQKFSWRAGRVKLAEERFLQNPKGSAELWGPGPASGPANSFRILTT